MPDRLAGAMPYYRALRVGSWAWLKRRKPMVFNDYSVLIWAVRRPMLVIMRVN